MLDGLGLFTGTTASPKQSITATAASTNIIDTLNPRDLSMHGAGPPLKLLCFSDGLFASADGTATLQIKIQGAQETVPGNATPGTYYDILLSPVLTITDLNLDAGGSCVFETDWAPVLANSGLLMPFPRFYRLDFVAGTENFTAGSIQAWLAIQDQQTLPRGNYPSGFTVAN
jgi:hypothetical protein